MKADKLNKKTEKKMGGSGLNFIYGVTHELRTPLALIKSSAEILSFYLEMDQQNKKLHIQEHIGIINAEAERLNKILDDLLLLGEIESGKKKPGRKALDIIPAINDIVSRQNSLQPDGRNVLLQVTGLPVKIMLEKAQLERILDNVLSNAFKYSAGKNEPELRVHFAKSYAQINVKDHGIGIPEDEQNMVYESFFRARNTQDIQGNGLGLMLTRHLVYLNNGNISFSSLENEGTEFIITFPYH